MKEKGEKWNLFSLIVTANGVRFVRRTYLRKKKELRLNTIRRTIEKVKRVSTTLGQCMSSFLSFSLFLCLVDGKRKLLNRKMTWREYKRRKRVMRVHTARGKMKRKKTTTTTTTTSKLLCPPPSTALFYPAICIEAGEREARTRKKKERRRRTSNFEQA